MPKLPRASAKRILDALLKAGFYIHHHTGSHANLRHHIKQYLHVVIPARNRDLAPKTIKSILIQAELTIEEFIEILKK